MAVPTNTCIECGAEFTSDNQCCCCTAVHDSKDSCVPRHTTELYESGVCYGCHWCYHLYDKVKY